MAGRPVRPNWRARSSWTSERSLTGMKESRARPTTFGWTNDSQLHPLAEVAPGARELDPERTVLPPRFRLRPAQILTPGDASRIGRHARMACREEPPKRQTGHQTGSDRPDSSTGHQCISVMLRRIGDSSANEHQASATATRTVRGDATGFCRASQTVGGRGWDSGKPVLLIGWTSRCLEKKGEMRRWGETACKGQIRVFQEDRSSCLGLAPFRIAVDQPR